MAKMRQVDGFTEILDEDGKVIQRLKDKRRKKKIQDPKSLTTKEPPEKELHLAELPNGEKAYIPQGLNLDTLPREIWPYGEAWSAKICAGVTEGKSLTAVCRQEGYPDIGTVFRWRRLYPEFEAEYQEARRMKADYFEDRILHLLEQLEVGDIDVKKARLQVEGWQWAAEIADRRTYQKTMRIEPEIPAMNITIVTGVPDPEEPKWVPSQDKEYVEAAEKSPIFFQASVLKEGG